MYLINGTGKVRLQLMVYIILALVAFAFDKCLL